MEVWEGAEKSQHFSLGVREWTEDERAGMRNGKGQERGAGKMQSDGH